jgi:hypothetical protein
LLQPRLDPEQFSTSQLNAPTPPRHAGQNIVT